MGLAQRNKHFFLSFHKNKVGLHLGGITQHSVDFQHILKKIRREVRQVIDVIYDRKRNRKKNYIVYMSKYNYFNMSVNCVEGELRHNNKDDVL